MTYLLLFWEFFKTGLFAVGGGMATIPFLNKMADSGLWECLTREKIANMIAVSESTPGPIGVNMATYVGFLVGQDDSGVLGAILGAVVATLGLVTPSIIVILIVAAILKSFKNNKYVGYAFYGLRPASTGLIGAAGLGVIATTMFTGGVVGFNTINIKAIILGVVLWIFTNLIKQTKKLHPIVFIALSAVVGIVFKM